MTGLSFITFTKNSASRIGGLLEHVKDIVDEIVVIDGYSVDETVEIAKSYGAKVYLRKPWGYAEPDRMFALKKVTNPWVLYLDDDERLCRRLKNDIRKFVEFGEKHKISAFSITRVNLNKNMKPVLGPWYPDTQVRIYRKDRVIYNGLIHELPKVVGMKYHLPEEYFIIHLNQEFWSKKKVHYVYIQKKQYCKPVNTGRTKRVLQALMPFSLIPYYFFILYACLIKRKPLNFLAIIYSFSSALYDGLLITLVKMRTKREEKIARVLSKRGLIPLLRLDE
ncbi:MAG: glycosyltransferase [Candidatus Bathyarchaeia archaeon]